MFKKIFWILAEPVALFTKLFNPNAAKFALFAFATATYALVKALLICLVSVALVPLWVNFSANVVPFSLYLPY